MNFSEDRLIVSSIKKCRDSLPIPTELITEIFSRLPAKSVKRYCFLSKFWYNVFRSQYFIDLFAAKSSARPQILFLKKNVFGISFSSAHQPSENSSDSIAPTHLTDYSISDSSCKYGIPINGLVCVRKFLRGRYVTVLYNPSTGESLTLPKMKTQSTHHDIQNLLGYDPIEKQFKLLSVVYYTWQWFSSSNINVLAEHQVLTLETEELSWRMIKCCTPHGVIGDGICINGVLYYYAIGLLNVQLIVCFDVRTETFRFMKLMETFNKELLWWQIILTNYDGKLALLIPEKSNGFITKESKSFELWVLKDAEKHEWSTHVYVVPPDWTEVVRKNILLCIGMISSNEIVLSSSCHQSGWVHKYPYIFYFNIEKNSIRRIDIQGLEKTPENKDVYMYLNHIEGVGLFKLLK